MLRSVNGCWSWRGLIRRENVLIYKGLILFVSVDIPVFSVQSTHLPYSLQSSRFGLQQNPALGAALEAPELFPNLALPQGRSSRERLGRSQVNTWKFTASNSARENYLFLLKNLFSSSSLVCFVPQLSWAFLLCSVVTGTFLCLSFEPLSPLFYTSPDCFLRAQPSLNVCCSCYPLPRMEGAEELFICNKATPHILWV